MITDEPDLVEARLLLTTTRRLPLADHEATGTSIDGDTALARRWLDNTAHDSD